MTALHPVLYQLYMIPSFRKGLLSLPESEFHSTDKLNNLPYQLKKVFEQYDSSDKLPDLKSLCYAFKDFNGSPTDPLAQFDAVDFLDTFFDQLDNSLKSLGKDQILNKVIRGKILHQLISKDCSHISSRPEDFDKISLDIRNKKGLEDGLTQFVAGEPIEGYLCNQCQKKGDVIKRVCLSEIPDYLCFQLQRIVFDLDTLENLLLKDYFELPNVVNLRPFTHEGLSGKSEEEKSSSAENNKYRLSGAVVYCGSSPDSGFYYSLVRDREDGETWYKIGPKGKEKFDPKGIPEEAFGGGEGSKKPQGCAYMVFYDKIDSQEHNVSEKEP